MHFFVFLVLLAGANASPVAGNFFSQFRGSGGGSASASGSGSARANGGNGASNTKGGNGASNTNGGNQTSSIQPAAAPASTIQVDPGFDSTAAKSAEQAAASTASTLAASDNAQKVAQLMTASSAVQRLDILSQDSDWKFDFNTERADANGQGGTIVTANLASFPPTQLTGTSMAVGVLGPCGFATPHAHPRANELNLASFPPTQLTGTSMAVGVLGPCGFATPHAHPRANELNLVTQGTLVSAMTLENKARVINQTIGLYQMTVFPQGSMHMEFNPGCSNATFVAMFSSNDAGVQQTMTAFMNFGDQVVEATMGGSMTVNGKDIDAFKKDIPVNVALGVESCLKACGLKKRSLKESREVLKRGLPSRTLRL